MAIVDVDYVCLYNMSRMRIRSSKGSKLRSLVALFQFHSAVTVGRVIVLPYFTTKCLLYTAQGTEQ